MCKFQEGLSVFDHTLIVLFRYNRMKMKVEDQPGRWLLYKCQQACERLHCV
jgi:hypothetical protein